MPDIQDLKESADKLAKQARETAELGVQVAREQIHQLIKDPDMLKRVEDAEAAFDSQMREVSKRIEDGANQMFSVFNQMLSQAKAQAEKTTTEAAEGTAKPKD